MSVIKQKNFDFLELLKANNNREWFNNNKALYLENRTDITTFADNLLQKMNQHDQIETPSGRKSLFRIYRDVRFSKDKSPYKTHWSGSFKRATKSLRGGYYFHIDHENSFVAGGFWKPDKEDLQKIREDIVTDAEELRSIINTPNFIKTFGDLAKFSEHLKTAPKGFDRNHPDIDLLRFKQFVIGKYFSNKEVLAPDFSDQVNEVFVAMRPFLDYMSYVLTTDANGEPIY